MKTQEIKQPTFEEIIFDNRNKEYGAYSLRKTYNNNLMAALIISIALFVMAFGIPLLANMNKPIENKVPIEGTMTFYNGSTETEVPKIVPPKPQKISMEQIEKLVRFDHINVVESPDTAITMTTSEDPTIIITDTTGLVPFVSGSYTGTTDIFGGHKDTVLTFAPVMPEFPGGEKALRAYIAKNTRYPSEARELGIQGKVFVKFVVTKTGEVGEALIGRKVDPSLEAEAIRVVKTLPRFTPGSQQGLPVNVWFTLPIIFQIENKN